MELHMAEYDPLSLYPYEPIIDRKPVKWPGDAYVAVWIVPNIEHFHIDRFDPAPDVRNFARRDYGNRVGIWRLMEVLAKYNIRGTVALNSEVVGHYPRIIEEVLKLKWELMGHGATNSIMAPGLSAEAEEQIIAKARQIIEGLGQKMRGWLGPGLHETWNTLDLLHKYGVEYVADWVHDDLPVQMSNGLYTIPYTHELNDIPMLMNWNSTAAEFKQSICDAFNTLYAEGRRSPRTLCIALHPFLIGTAHRIRYLDEALQHISSHDKVWFATGSEIIDAFRTGETP
jgi:peptidoglycan/xylan/chitin deacetylase (PgdA/CDA1 family)